jgi:S-adenosylmethionine:tRNA ribosyltransferase-isomerase
MVLNRTDQTTKHIVFSEIVQFLASGDVLVLNNSEVIRARLRGNSPKSTGKFELLLLSQIETNEWWTMVRPGKRAQIGKKITITGGEKLIEAEVLSINDEGHRLMRFRGTNDIKGELSQIGEIPLPPYIRRNPEDERQGTEDHDRYQTVFASEKGSIAAPTAGLHFTKDLLGVLQKKGVNVCFVTLHVGLGTFAPVKADRVEDHLMHEERFTVDESTALTIEKAKASGARIFAVGTTTVRVLESVAARNNGRLIPGNGTTRIFIYPPFRFRIVDALLTNFHLPRSTLLMLVSAFAAPETDEGREVILRAYQEAIEAKFRFFSYGDAMLIL